MQAQDIYIKLTDPSGDKDPTVNYHRVWDKDKFLATQKHHFEVRAKGADKRDVSLTTEAEYKRFNRK